MEIQRCCSGGTRTKRICSKPACSATSQRVWKDIRKTCPGHLMSPEVQNGHNDVRRYLQSWKLSATECFIRKHVASNKLLWLGGCVTTCGGTPQNTGGGATTSRMSTSIDVRWRKYTTSTEGQDLNQRILNNHLQYVYCTYFYVTICLSGLVLPLLVPFCFILNIIATSECTDRFQFFNVFGI